MSRMPGTRVHDELQRGPRPHRVETADEGNDMHHPRTAVRGLVGLAALALVSGCVPGIGADAGGDGSDPHPVGRGQLTEEQIETVLPTDEQAPEGFAVDHGANEEYDPDAEGSAYPVSCLDVRLAGAARDDLDTHQKTKQRRTFTGDNGGSLSVRVTSYDTVIPDRLFDDAGASQSGCGTFKLIDKTGTTSWKLDQIAFPQMGDRTYSTRVEATTKGDPFRGGVVQIAGVAVGNNLIYTVYASGPQSAYDPAAVETFTQATVDNLNAL